jgi:hypothetical protein
MGWVSQTAHCLLRVERMKDMWARARTKIIIRLSLLLLGVSFLAAVIFFARPFLEPGLPFKVIARMGDPPSYPFGLGVYRPSQPALYVISEFDDIDNLPLLVSSPELADRLRQVDYGHYYALLAVRGRIGVLGYDIVIRRITRLGDNVSIWADFVDTNPYESSLQMDSVPFELVRVSKEGEWDGNIQFKLMNGYKGVVETIHFVP